MFVSPSALGWIYAKSKLKNFKPPAVKRPKGVKAGIPPSWSKVPISAYKRRASRHPSDKIFPPLTPECCNFKLADRLYQNMGLQEKDWWRRRVKKPGASAYDVWMTEALYLLNRGLNPPRWPSISGGFSGYKAKSEPGWFVNPCRKSDIFFRAHLQVYNPFTPDYPHIEYRMLPSFEIPDGTPTPDRPYIWISTGYDEASNKWNLYNSFPLQDWEGAIVARKKTDKPYCRIIVYPFGQNHPEAKFIARTTTTFAWTSLRQDYLPWTKYIDGRPTF